MDYDEIKKNLIPVSTEDLCIGEKYTISGSMADVHISCLWNRFYKRSFDIVAITRMTPKRTKIIVKSEITGKEFEISRSSFVNFWQYNHVVEKYIESVRKRALLINLMRIFTNDSAVKSMFLEARELIDYCDGLTENELDDKLKLYKSIKKYIEDDVRKAVFRNEE